MNNMYKLNNDIKYDYLDKDLYNLTYEEQFIINIIRNKSCDLYDIANLDFDLILEFMFDNKILINYSDYILSLPICEKIKSKIIISKAKYELRKKEYVDFIKRLLAKLNKFNYRIVKGLALQLMLENKYKRFFLDIDIVINNDLFNDLLDVLKKEFNVISVRNGICEKDCVVDIKTDNFYFTIEIKNTNHPCFINMNSMKKIDFNSSCLYTFNEEDTIIYLINYYYWNAYNLRNLRQSFKYFLQSIIEIYSLIKINYNLFDWEKIFNYFITNNRIEYIKNCLEDVYTIHRDSIILELINKFYRKIEQYNINDSYINTIPLIVRFFRKKEVGSIVKNYLSGKFLLYSNNEKYTQLYEENEEIKLYIFKNDNILKSNITFKNFNYSKNNKVLIQINLYAYDQFGMYLGPYIPTFILNDGKVLFSNEWIVDIHNDLLINNFENTLSNELVYLSHINLTNEIINFNFDLDVLNIDYNKNIGINVITYYINEFNKIDKIYSLRDDSDVPCILLNAYDKNLLS